MGSSSFLLLWTTMASDILGKKYTVHSHLQHEVKHTMAKASSFLIRSSFILGSLAGATFLLMLGIVQPTCILVLPNMSPNLAFFFNSQLWARQDPILHAQFGNWQGQCALVYFHFGLCCLGTSLLKVLCSAPFSNLFWILTMGRMSSSIYSKLSSRSTTFKLGGCSSILTILGSSLISSSWASKLVIGVLGDALGIIDPSSRTSPAISVMILNASPGDLSSMDPPHAALIKRSSNALNPHIKN